MTFCDFLFSNICINVKSVEIVKSLHSLILFAVADKSQFLLHFYVLAEIYFILLEYLLERECIKLHKKYFHNQDIV